MATEENSSIVIDSFASLKVLSSHISHKPISSVHQYCRKPSEDEPVRDSQNRILYYCSLCLYSGSSTINIRYHL